MFYIFLSALIGGGVVAVIIIWLELKQRQDEEMYFRNNGRDIDWPEYRMDEPPAPPLRFDPLKEDHSYIGGRTQEE